MGWDVNGTDKFVPWITLPNCHVERSQYSEKVEK